MPEIIILADLSKFLQFSFLVDPALVSEVKNCESLNVLIFTYLVSRRNPVLAQKADINRISLKARNIRILVSGTLFW